MTLTELSQLSATIFFEYSVLMPRKHPRARQVKYFHPNIDMRSGHCFSVTLRGFGWERVIHTQNECNNLERTLEERIIAYLDGNDNIDT